MFFRSMGIFLHVIFFRYVPIWALRTTTLEIESIEARAGCKSCGLVHLDKTLSLSWSMFPPSPIPGRSCWMSWSQLFFFFLQKMCSNGTKNPSTCSERDQKLLFFWKRSALFPRNLFVLGGNGQISMWGTFFSQEHPGHIWGPTRLQYLLLLLTKSLCVLG